MRSQWSRFSSAILRATAAGTITTSQTATTGATTTTLHLDVRFIFFGLHTVVPVRRGPTSLAGLTAPHAPINAPPAPDQQLLVLGVHRPLGQALLLATASPDTMTRDRRHAPYAIIPASPALPAQPLALLAYQEATAHFPAVAVLVEWGTSMQGLRYVGAVTIPAEPVAGRRPAALPANRHIIEPSQALLALVL